MRTAGCGMAFLSWLMSQGHALSAITPVMVSLGDSGTLAQLYAALTSDAASNAWPNFLSALRTLSGGVTNDDPFGGALQPTQIVHIAPWTLRLAGNIFSAIVADLAAGKEEHQILASVRAAMVSVPRPNRAISPAACSPKSHEFRPPRTD